MNDESSSKSVSVDAEALREQVRSKYSEVATNPENEFHFHTGRELADRFGYDETITSTLPDHAIESFAGVANPFSLRDLAREEKVVDLGSGAGFDCFVAAKLVGEEGKVIGVDMTPEMLSKARQSAKEMHLTNTEFRNGLLEDLPVEDNWADVAISNGVINLCSDKPKVLAEIMRILKPGGYFQFADIANSKPVPKAATENIDLWTA
ncbi:MAG: SAM-dependent methyltransferase [Pseudohongiellaceae bacterium]|jgi:SAM-dependent methyltransferase